MAFSFEQETVEQEAPSATVGDVARNAGSSLMGMAASPFSAGQVALQDEAPRAALLMRGMSKLFHSGEDYLEEGITPGGKAARDASIIGSEPGRASVWQAPIASLFMKGSGVAPQIAAMALFPEGALAQAVLGGAMQGTANIDTIVKYTNGRTDQQLAAESPVFNSLLEQGMDPEEARKKLISAQIDAKDLLAAAVIGAAGMGSAARVLKKGALAGEKLGARTTVGALDAGAGMGGTAAQSDVSAQHSEYARGGVEGEGDVDWHRTFAAGLDAFLEGSIIGGGGGAMHGPKGKAGEKPKPKTEATETNASGVDPSITAALGKPAEALPGVVTPKGAIDLNAPNLDVTGVLNEALPGTKGGVDPAHVGNSQQTKGPGSGAPPQTTDARKPGRRSYKKEIANENVAPGVVTLVEPTAADPAQTAALEAVNPTPRVERPRPSNDNAPEAINDNVPRPPEPPAAPRPPEAPTAVEPPPEAPAPPPPEQVTPGVTKQEQPPSAPSQVAPVAQPEVPSTPPVEAPPPPAPKPVMTVPSVPKPREATNVVERVVETPQEKEDRAARVAAAAEHDTTVARSDKQKLLHPDNDGYDNNTRAAALREAVAAEKQAKAKGTELHPLYAEIIKAHAAIPAGRGDRAGKEKPINAFKAVEKRLRQAKHDPESGITPPEVNKGGRKATSEAASNVARRGAYSENKVAAPKDVKLEKANKKKEVEARTKFNNLRARKGVKKEARDEAERRWLAALEKVRELTREEELRKLELKQESDARTEVTGRDITALGDTGVGFKAGAQDHATLEARESGGDALETYDREDAAQHLAMDEVGSHATHDEKGDPIEDAKGETAEHDYGEVKLTPEQERYNAAQRGDIKAEGETADQRRERFAKEGFEPIEARPATKFELETRPKGERVKMGIKPAIGIKGKIALGVRPAKKPDAVVEAAPGPSKVAPPAILRGATAKIGDATIRHSSLGGSTPFVAKTHPDAVPKHFHTEREAREYIDKNVTPEVKAEAPPPAPPAEAPKPADTPKAAAAKAATTKKPRAKKAAAETPAAKKPPKVVTAAAKKVVEAAKGMKKPRTKKGATDTVADTRAKIDAVHELSEQMTAEHEANERNKADLRNASNDALEKMNQALAESRALIEAREAARAPTRDERIAAEHERIGKAAKDLDSAMMPHRPDPEAQAAYKLKLEKQHKNAVNKAVRDIKKLQEEGKGGEIGLLVHQLMPDVKAEVLAKLKGAAPKRTYETGEHPTVTVVAHSAGTHDSLRREIHDTIADATQGDIFTAGADAVVSPSNSVGHMNGGIDLRYLNHFGKQLERRVREKIVAEYGGELPIGEAFVIRTRPEGEAIRPNEPEWMIVSPTMTQPGVGRATPDVVHKATLAALRAGREAGVEHIALPSMGTGVGKLDPNLSAKAMQQALHDFEAEVHGDTQKSKFNAEEIRARAEAMRKEMEAEAGERMQPVYHGTRDTTTERTINTQDIKLRRSDLHGGEAHYGWYTPEQALDWAKEKFGDRASIFTSFIPQSALQRLSKTKDVVVRPMHWQKDGSPDPAYPHEVVLSAKALDEIYTNERLLSKHEGAETMTDTERLALIQEALGPDAKVALNSRENSFERRKGLIRLMADADRTSVLHEIFHAVERTLKPHEMALVQNHPMFKEVMAQVKVLYPELSPRGQFMEGLAETSARLRNQHLSQSLLWRTIEKVRAKLAAWGRLVTGGEIKDVRDLLHEVYSGVRKSERAPSMNERLAEVAQSRFMDAARAKFDDARDQPGFKAAMGRISNKFQTFNQLGRKGEMLGVGDSGRKAAEMNERMHVWRETLLDAPGGGHEVTRELFALSREFAGDAWSRFVKLAHDSTIANVHPDVALSDAKNSHISGDKTRDFQSKARHAQLMKEFHALPPELKAAWHKTTDLFQHQENLIREQMVANHVEAILGKADTALAKKIHEGTLSAADAANLKISAGMKALLEAPEMRTVKGAYFPLMRRGEYVVHGEYKLEQPGVTKAYSKATKKGKKVEYDVTSEVKPGTTDTMRFTTDATKKGAQSALRRAVGEYVGNHSVRQNAISSFKSDAAGKADPNGDHVTYEATFHTKHVEFHDSLKEANAAHAQLAGVLDMKAVDRKRAGLWTNGDLMSARLQTILKSMEQRPEWAKKTQGERDTIKQTLIEASLRSASQGRLGKRLMERKGIAGADTDLARNVLDYSSANASFLAGQKFRPQIENHMREMGRQIDADPYSKDMIARRDLQNEMQERLNQSSDPETARGPMDTVINKALQLSFLDKLASPAFHAVNGLQPGMVTLPVLMGKHNFRAVGAMTRAYKDLGGLSALKQGLKETARAFKEDTSFDYLKSFSDRIKDAGAQAMLKELHEVGLLDRHAGMEIGELVNPDANTFWRGVNRADHMARQMGQAVESLNRAVSALAAYRLEMDLHGNHERAVNYAKDVVHDTQGNYSRSNAPAAFNSRLGRATLQFKKFTQMMYSLLGKQLGQALRGDKDAMKTLIGIGVSHAAMAGVLGLPTEPIKMMLMASNALGVTNTQWGDVEQMAREQAAHYLGKTGGEIFTKGLPRLLGIDLSSRVGLDSLLTFSEPRSTKQNDVKAWLWDTVKGAPMGYGEDLVKGGQALMGGDIEKAAELIIPIKLVADMLKAGKGYASGKSTARGKELMTPYSPLEAGARAFGFTPAREAETNAASSAAYKATADLRETRRKLIADYSGGKVAMQDIVKFNAGRPQGEQIKISSLQRAKKDSTKPEVLGQTVQPWNKRTLEGVGNTYNTR